MSDEEVDVVSATITKSVATPRAPFAVPANGAFAGGALAFAPTLRGRIVPAASCSAVRAGEARAATVAVDSPTVHSSADPACGTP